MAQAIGYFIIVVGTLMVLAYFRHRSVQTRRHRFIAGYQFPEKISSEIRKKYPLLNSAEAAHVIATLREYFHVCHDARVNMVSMPSQVVDEAWHEFILFTREYERFCDAAFGSFLHHTPTEAMLSRTRASQGLKNTWRYSCYRSGIDPSAPTALPILFAIDKKLSIPDGFHYSLDCNLGNNQDYCASGIGCSGSGDSISCGGCGGD